jgi:hypothetical protein
MLTATCYLLPATCYLLTAICELAVIRLRAASELTAVISLFFSQLQS